MHNENIRANVAHVVDPELQQALARDGLRGLDQLLTGQAAGEMIAADRVGALVRLISQAMS